jgi:hypothetical protein
MPVPPVSGEAFTFYVTLTSQANTNIFQVNPTLAIGDVTVSTDGGALNNITTLPVVTPAGGKQVQVDLSIAEMTGDVIGVLFSDVAGNEWQDLYIEILTDAQQIGDIPTAAANADAVWDEVLTVATHDVGYSAGQRLRYLILTGNVAQDGTANSIRLAAAESAVDNIFNENIISIVGGLGAGQTRLIAEYEGATNWAIVDRPWFVAPNNTSVYEILPFSSILLADHGVALGGSPTTIELAATASAIDDIYNGCTVFISSGTGYGQARVIIDYDGGLQIATVAGDWTVDPDNTSVYKILPIGRVIVEFCPMLGEGAITWTYTLTSTVPPFDPIPDADVWVTTDIAGLNVIASGKTDAFGVVTFFLDPGTIYVWRQKSGWDFVNPDTEVIA